jgi:hypothetical protein
MKELRQYSVINVKAWESTDNSFVSNMKIDWKTFQIQEICLKEHNDELSTDSQQKYRQNEWRPLSVLNVVEQRGAHHEEHLNLYEGNTPNQNSISCHLKRRDPQTPHLSICDTISL